MSSQPKARTLVRRATLVAGVAAAAASTVVAFVSPAGAAPTEHHVTHAPHSAAAHAVAMAFLADTNKAREEHGLNPVVWSSTLARYADHHSERMVNTSTLFHNLALPKEVWNWTTIGENVGEGPTESSIQYAFMHSAPHRANILDKRYTELAIGIAEDSQGDIWVTEDFRRPEAGTHSAREANRKIRSLVKAERR